MSFRLSGFPQESHSRGVREVALPGYEASRHRSSQIDQARRKIRINQNPAATGKGTESPIDQTGQLRWHDNLYKIPILAEENPAQGGIFK